ncbi:MAG: glycoside hydrolase family 127 protein [Clostridia bacterium]|nr:glycoside hydrolase family 127 protein [Clostridia bacterium]
MAKYKYFSPSILQPKGWLKSQLEIQAEGLSGNLDKIWPDIRDSAWIGGKAEGWERVPYWLDGFIPLAYLLRNEDMIKRAQKYVDAIINQQKPDGWICPCSDEARETYDTWATQLISKVLVVYYECSKDERIPEVIYNVLKNYYELLSNGKIKLFNWGLYRWFECFVAINFLYEKYKEPWIKDLAKILKDQGTDYYSLEDKWKTPLYNWEFFTHIVNMTMMIKTEAITCDILGEKYEDKGERIREVLHKYNGTAVETFTGDECLAGLSPIHGTELCAVVEQMYSYETLYAFSGDVKWADRLEVLAFNTLPATLSDDMWTHQYDQLSNQISCQKFRGRPIFGTNCDESHLFGLEPGYGCCTANFNQGFPKFAWSTFAYNNDEVVSVIPVPSAVSTEDYSIELITNYPFENNLLYKINAKKDFTFKIRVPSFAKSLKVNGKETEKTSILTFQIKKGETEISVSFDADIELVDRPHDLKTVKCGSLVFSIPIKYKKEMLEFERNGVERKFPYCDYEYIGQSDWNYAYSSDKFEIERKDVSDIPFDSQNPPVTIKAKVKKIDWGFEEGYNTVCAKVPSSREAISEEIEIKLHPYGAAKLRMTEIPLIK